MYVLLLGQFPMSVCLSGLEFWAGRSQGKTKAGPVTRRQLTSSTILGTHWTLVYIPIKPSAEHEQAIQEFKSRSLGVNRMEGRGSHPLSCFLSSRFLLS